MSKFTKEDIHIQLASQKDIPVLHAVYNRAKMSLEEQDLFQWDDVYPSRAFFEHACMQEASLHCLRRETNHRRLCLK